MTVIELGLVGRARPSTRLAHRASAIVLRPTLEHLAAIGASGPARGYPAFRAANAAEYLAWPLRPSAGTARRRVDFAGFRAEWLWHSSIDGPDDREGGAIVYFHGGAFVAGGLHSHRRLVARLARMSGMPALNVAYRQLPAARFDVSLDDAITAYRRVLDDGFEPSQIVLAGDSAGGGLAVAAGLAVGDLGLPRPAAIAAIAPFADLDSTRRANHPNDAVDPVLSSFILSVPVDEGMRRDGVLDPAWSAVNHDFTDLPPLFIQAGSTEVVRADAELLAARCAQAGVPYRLQVWDQAVHVFIAAADVLPEAREALRDLAAFIRTSAASGGNA